MEAVFILTSETFSLVVLPILIFCARILDVSLSTLRIVFISKGWKKISPFIGFFEVLIWLLAIGQIMQNLNNPINYIAYAGGFAAGTYIGLIIEEKLAMGSVIIRIFTKKNTKKLKNFLKEEGYGVTTVNAMGGSGPCRILLTIVNRKDLKDAIKQIRKFNPKSFYSIEDIKYVNKGKFPRHRNRKSLLKLKSKRK